MFAQDLHIVSLCDLIRIVLPPHIGQISLFINRLSSWLVGVWYVLYIVAIILNMNSRCFPHLISGVERLYYSLTRHANMYPTSRNDGIIFGLCSAHTRDSFPLSRSFSSWFRLSFARIQLFITHSYSHTHTHAALGFLPLEHGNNSNNTNE